MGKLRIGSCPRCRGGEIFIDRDLYGWYECCLQCGYTRDLPDIVLPVPARSGNLGRSDCGGMKDSSR